MFVVQIRKTKTTMENQTSKKQDCRQFDSTNVDQIAEINKEFAGATTMSELEQFAIAKSKFVLPGCQLRLNANPSSYFLLNNAGTIYIGCMDDDSTLQMMFPNKKVFLLKNKGGKTIGSFQKLF